MGDLVLQPRLRHRRGGVAAADDGHGAVAGRRRPSRARSPGCRGRTAASRTRPSARSRPRCPRRSIRAAKSLLGARDRCRRPPSPRGCASRGTVRVSAPALSSRATTAPGRQHQLVPRARSGARRASSSRSGSTSELPVSRPIAAKKVHAIAPPIRIWSTLGSSASIRSILPLILAPPSTATNGRFGLVQRLAEVAQLPLHQEAGDRRLEHPRHRFGARVRAVGRAEGVVHVEIAQRGEPRRQRRRRCSPRPGRTGCSRRPPRRRAAAAGSRSPPARESGSREEGDRRAEQPLQRPDHRLHRVLGVGPALRPAEVGQQHQPGPAARGGTRWWAARPGSGCRR